MIFNVRLFARARDLGGADHLTLDLPHGATVADLRRRLVALHPQLAELEGKCAVAVDAEFANDGRVLTEGAEIALLPPVSGG
jgi:molybdopterin converting factor subunit 1